MKPIIDSILREIKEDRTTPAAELVRKGVDAIALFITNFSGGPSFFFSELIRLSRVLIDSQPSMAPFFHLANILLLAAEGRPNLDEMKEATRDAIRGFVIHLQESGERISRIARSLIPHGARVLTHSHSSTVLKTLVDASKEGKQFEVICTESRPLGEGFNMARKLTESHVRVQVQIDSAAPYMIKDVNLVMVGADSLTPFGLVNKVGTYALALSAKERGVHFYTLCGTEKLLGAGMAKKYRILRRDPQEIWPDAPEGADVFNFYFDATPLKYLTAIFTEEGILRGDEVIRRFQRMKVSPHFPT